MKMNQAYIGLGSNIEPRKEYLDRAIEKLSNHDSIHICNISSIYETPPVGYENQDSFLNMVIKIETSLKNVELLEVCQSIEAGLDRVRTIENGPRTIDLDILLYNHEYRELERLILPHPRMKERAFVLVPLNEIAPGEIMPTSGKAVEDLLHDLPENEVDEIILWEES